MHAMLNFTILDSGKVFPTEQVLICRKCNNYFRVRSFGINLACSRLSVSEDDQKKRAGDDLSLPDPACRSSLSHIFYCPH